MNPESVRGSWLGIGATAVVAAALPLVWELLYALSPRPSAHLDLPAALFGVMVGAVWVVWRLGWWGLAANVIYCPTMFYVVAGFALALGEWNAFHVLRSAIWRFVGLSGS